METCQLKIQKRICENLAETLNKYKGNFVAISYDGKIITEDSTEVGLFEKIEKLKIPKRSIFIYKVGAEAVGGWL